jgi:hypothetical protein
MITLSIWWLIVPVYLVGVYVFAMLIGFMTMDTGIDSALGRLGFVCAVVFWPMVIPLSLILYFPVMLTIWIVKGDNY